MIQFHSITGSLDGSSLDYLFRVRKIIPEKKIDANLVSRNCSHTITLGEMSSGVLMINPNDFDFPINGRIQCNLTFVANTIVHGRVNLSILSTFNPSLSCGKYCDIGIFGSNQAKLLIHQNVDSNHFLAPLCYCEPISTDFPFTYQSPLKSLQNIQILSNSSILRASISLPPDWAKRDDSKPIQVR